MKSLSILYVLQETKRKQERKKARSRRTYEIRLRPIITDTTINAEDSTFTVLMSGIIKRAMYPITYVHT